VSEAVGITVATTVETVGLAVAGGDTVALAVSAPVEAIAITVAPETDAVALAVAETVEQLSLTVAPAGESVAVAIANHGDTVTLVVAEAEAELAWTDLVTRWDSPPTQAATIGSGSVFAYVLDGTTRYRLVPSPYSAAGDAFYATFGGGVLSGLLAARG
jgi:hypothetical protein